MKLSLVCEPAPIPGRLNEDACFLCADAQTVTAAAIDGATQRIDVPALYDQPGTSQHGTAARVAAQVTRYAFYQHVHRDPETMILAANAALRTQIEQVAALTAADFARLAPDYAAMLDDDPRLIRLMLPVCVATVLKLDLETNTARFAHVGDTALFAFYKDGRVSRMTEDQMGQHDATAFDAALALKAELDAPHLSDVLYHNRVRSINRRNGLYHNYVDANGQPDRSLGVGVIDGLPQINAYIQTGTIDLDAVAGLLVCSDGFPLPAPWHESPEAARTRLAHMRDMLFEDGIDAYYAHLRDMQARDEHRDRYPRFKVHDDTTGVLIELARR